VDPLAVPGLPGFGALLADPGVEKIFHDADYDLRLLGHEFGFRATRVFDTRIAAQFLNEPGIGLAALLQKYFGVTLDKKFQRADWSQRPLSPAMLEYAATDTRHLPSLRTLLRERLAAIGRLGWVEEECVLATMVRWPDPEPVEISALSIKGARALTPKALAVFRALVVWRTRTAEALDRAAFRIMSNEAIFALTERLPADRAGLGAVPGVGREIAERRGHEILGAIREGLAVPETELPRFPRPERRRPDPAFEVRVERLRTVRSGIAARLDLPPGLVAPNWLLERIASRAPQNVDELAQVDGVRKWQISEFGQQLIIEK
jgi:ribonuclease D